MNYQERVYDLILDEATRTQKALGGLAAVASLGLGGLAGLQPRATAKEIKPEERVEKKAPKRVGLPSVSKRAPVVTDKGKEEISKEKTASDVGHDDQPFPRQAPNPHRVEQLKKGMADRREARLSKRLWKREADRAGGTMKSGSRTDHKGVDRAAILQLNSKGKWDFHSWE